MTWNNYEEEVTDLEKSIKKLKHALTVYGGHRNDSELFCEALKHSENKCTCGWDDLKNAVILGH